MWQTIGVWQTIPWIGTLRAATAAAREIDADITSHPSLPIIYYAPYGTPVIWGGPAQTFFPSTYLYPLVSGMQDHRRLYLAHYEPTSSHRPATGGPAPYPHVMVVPEYRGADPSDPQAIVFGGERFPAFDSVRADPANRCVEHRVIWAWYGVEVPGRPTVTVCVVR